MTVTITPGQRDEELIAKIREARQTMTKDEWLRCCNDAIFSSDEKWVDALYYTVDDEREEILAAWEEFLHERLMHGHVCGFVNDLAALRGKNYRGKY